MGWSGYALLKTLEDEAGPYADPSRLKQAGIKYIVVLGGTGIYDDMFPPDTWESVNPRFLEAVRLWCAVPGAMLLMSGGRVVPLIRWRRLLSGLVFLKRL